MTYYWEWTDRNEAVIYADADRETKIGVTETQKSGKVESEGIPCGAKIVVSDWVNEQLAPDEQKLKEAVERLSSLITQDFVCLEDVEE